MYESEFFKTAKNILESSRGVRQALELLPEGSEVEIVLDNRIASTLKLSTELNKVELLPYKSAQVELSYTVFPESIRRLTERNPKNIMQLSEELTRMMLIGQVKFQTRNGWRSIFKKGYFAKWRQLIS